MRLAFTCMECSKEALPDTLMSVIVRDDGKYVLTCPKGHKTTTLVQQQHFELLFELGAHALLDEYFREAVSSFSASLERFQEFYVKVVGLRHDLKGVTFLDVWSKVAKQSERQLGAYMFLYALENKSAPDVLSDDERKFRNDVTHRGKIPTPEEAIKYGNRVLELIRPVLKELKTEYPNEVNDAVSQHVAKLRQSVDADEQLAFMCQPTIVSVAVSESEAVDTLEEALPKLKKWRKAFGV